MMKHWLTKFRNAFLGIYWGTVGESSFVVHILAALLVIAGATVLGCSALEWCILLLCIGFVFSLELLNSAIEKLARGLCQEHNEEVGRALDISSGAVLCGSLAAAIVGMVVFLPKILSLWQ